jgi:hypothetical protein
MATRRRSRRKSISGNLTDIQKRIRYLETRPAAGRLASKAVATRNLALRAVEEDVVADNAIVRRAIAASAVGTAQIEADSITNALLATNSVNTDSIAAGSVTADEIAGGAVGTGQLGNDSVTTDKIATGAVTTGELGNDSVTNDKLASNSVNADSIAAGSVGETELASSAVTTDKIADEAVTDAKIDGISGSKIIGGIDGALIVADSITTAKIDDLAITTAKIQNLAITTAKIQNLAVTTDKLDVLSVTSTRLAEASVGQFQLKKYEIFADNIYQNSIVGSAGTHPFGGTKHIQTGSIGSTDIAIGAVLNSRLGAESVTVGKIQSGAGIVTGLNSTGVGVSFSNSAATFGRTYTLAISTGTGSNQLAVGNHTHAAGSVGAHTHSASLSMSSMSISGGTHAHTIPQTGAHTHGFTPTGSVTIGAVETSTLKLKKDISDFAITDPKNILNLKMKKYKYKNSVRGIQNRYNREWMYGYIAEEVQDLGVEQILAYDKNGDPDGINYGLLSVLVLELVKVQQSEIDSLKEEIQRLKETI